MISGRKVTSGVTCILSHLALAQKMGVSDGWFLSADKRRSLRFPVYRWAVSGDTWAVKVSIFPTSKSTGGTIGKITQLAQIGNSTEREPMTNAFSSFLSAKRRTSARMESMDAVRPRTAKRAFPCQG